MSSPEEYGTVLRQEEIEHEAARSAETVPEPPDSSTGPATDSQSVASVSESEIPEASTTPPNEPHDTAEVLAMVPEIQIEFPQEAPSEEAGELDHLMMADMEKSATLPRGEIVQAKVLKISDTEVFVDVDSKGEAAVPLAEFQNAEGTVAVEVGDTVDVWIESFDPKRGMARVSRQKAARKRLWEDIERASKEQTNLKGKVVERVKGGLAVDVGIKAFMPSSHADIRPLRNPEALVGKEVEVKVIKFIRKRGNLVVSRKLVQEEEANRKKAELMEKIHVGAEITGRVKNLTDYGAFVDLDGMDGLLHITDMAWHRVKHPSEAVQVGREVKVQVLKFDGEKGHVSLGMKQLMPDPWGQIADRFHRGDRVRGRVVSLTDYGAFVEIEPGVEGLIHISEMSWSKRQKHPSKILNKDDQVEVAVLEVKPNERRLSLSLRETLANPWTTLPERYSVGTEIEVVVRNMAEFGAFVEVEPGVEGLIHISDMSWKKKVRHPSEMLKKGNKIKAVVLKIDSENRRLSLGLKQLEPDPWETFLATTRVGDVVHGKVVRVAPFGAFVELLEGVEGLCHNSEMNGATAGGKKSSLEAGSEFDFHVTRVNATERKIGLSLRERARPQAAKAIPAPAPVEKKDPKPKTAMAEAFSSAGITTVGARAAE